MRYDLEYRKDAAGGHVIVSLVAQNYEECGMLSELFRLLLATGENVSHLTGRLAGEGAMARLCLPPLAAPPLVDMSDPEVTLEVEPTCVIKGRMKGKLVTNERDQEGDQ